MDEYTRSAEIFHQRQRLTPKIVKVMPYGDSDALFAKLDAAAERFRKGEDDLTTFRVRCTELESETDGYVTVPAGRERPQTRTERTVYAITAAGVLAALVWVLLLVLGVVGPDARPGQADQSGRYGTGVITLDVGALPNSDCWYEVDMRDPDGEPGGVKTVHVEPLCP